MAGNDKFGMKEVLDVTLYDMETGKPVIRFDSLKNSSINITADKVSARGGRGNNKLTTWEFNKEGTLTVEDALLSPKSIELVSGVATVNGAQTLHMRQATEYDTTGDTPTDKGELYPLKTTAAGKVTLAYAPKEDKSKIIVYKADDEFGTPVEVSAVSEKELTLTGINAVTNVVVYYTFDSAADTQTYTIDAKTFSGTYKLVGDTVIRNSKTGKDEPFQVIIPNLKWSSAFTFSLSAEGDPSTQSFECDILKPADSAILVQMVRYK